MRVTRTPALTPDFTNQYIGWSIIAVTVILSVALLVWIIVRSRDVWVKFNGAPWMVLWLLITSAGLAGGVIMLSIREYSEVGETIIYEGYVTSASGDTVKVTDNKAPGGVRRFSDNGAGVLEGAKAAPGDYIVITRSIHYIRSSEVGTKQMFSADGIYHDIEKAQVREGGQ